VLRTNPNVLPVFIGMVGVSFAAAMDRPALIVLVRETTPSPRPRQPLPKPPAAEHDCH
jgi:hypothetical protein